MYINSAQIFVPLHNKKWKQKYQRSVSYMKARGINKPDYYYGGIIKNVLMDQCRIWNECENSLQSVARLQGKW